MTEPFFIKAIRELVPTLSFTGYDHTTLTSINEVALPSKADIDAKIVELEAEWTANAYSRNRKAEYPDWGDQLNKIYDDGVTKWKSEMVDPVKAKWPKDNSGPV
jgi:hypothetical protein